MLNELSTKNPQDFMSSSRLQAAIRCFECENARDPVQVTHEGVAIPKELFFARQTVDWVKRIDPQASDELILAAHAHHVCRWMMPRENFEMTRAGYLRWRTELKKFHAERAGEILHKLDYSAAQVERVQAIILRRDLKNDRESQVLEDAICLVFLQYQFREFAHRTDDEKMIPIIQKTWKKMSPKAQAIALTLPLGPQEQLLVDRALQPMS